jgi:glycosyltransferase involved in cell wall biosynthesis
MATIPTLESILSGSLTTNSINVPVSTGNPTKKLKFMLVSTHCQQYTGYSKVSYGIINELAKMPWLEVFHFGFQKFAELKIQEGYRPYPSNVKVIDAAPLENPPAQGFGFKVLPSAISTVEPDIIMIYNDMSVVANFINEIDKAGVKKTFKLWVYVDQVYPTQLKGYLDLLNLRAEHIFTFSPYWKKCLKDQGVTRPIDVILHGFDSNVFKQMDRKEIRKAMNIPEDAFLYLNLNRNQPRKRYDIMVMAFVELLVKYPTKPIYLLCICDKGEKGGWWIFEIFQRELELRGVAFEPFANRIMLTSVDMIFPDEQITSFYNVANAGVNSADGEGWGLCNFEQMGIGIPQVVPNLGGFKEFCNTSNSVLVEPTVRNYLPTVFSPVGGETNAMTPHDLCLGMEEYVLDSEKLAKHGEEARKTVLTYTWKRAVEPLIRRLKQTKEDIEAEAET